MKRKTPEDNKEVYGKFPQFTFKPQEGAPFDLETAKWCMLVCKNAMNLHEKIEKEYVKDVKNVTDLYWHELIWITLKGQDTTCGYIGEIKGTKDTLVLVLRGTDTTAEWVTDFEFKHKPVNFMKKIKGNIEDGFDSIYTHIAAKYGKEKKESLHDQIHNLLKTKYKNAKTIYITGHSLGAAVATIAAIDLAVSFPDLNFIVYTFASPRVGDPVFMKSFVNHVKTRKGIFYLYRVHNYSDVVPTVPEAAPEHGLQYQHTPHEVVGCGEKEEKPNFYFNTIPFEVNNGSIEANHNLCTYLMGLTCGKIKCS